MTAMANMGSLVVALPPADIWLTDEQAADFLVKKSTKPISIIINNIREITIFFYLF